MGRKILVLGSSNVDLILRIPRFPKPGETLIGQDLVTAYGGKGANQAIAARRLGGDVTFITKLGNDPFGQSYRKYLIQNGLGARGLLQSSELPTGVALIELTPRGENRIIVSPGANAALSARDLKNFSRVWKDIRVLLTQLEIPLATVRTGLMTARRHGALTLLNPSPVTPLPSEILSLLDFLVLNEGEAECLAGIKMRKRGDLSRIAGRLLGKGVKNVVVTLGPRGLFYKNGDRELGMVAFPVKATDTTGAGDAFTGALACGIAEEKPIGEVLRLANAAGALAATRLGAQPSIPMKRALDKFLRQAGKVGKSSPRAARSHPGS
jgi:ribokinase